MGKISEFGSHTVSSAPNVDNKDCIHYNSLYRDLVKTKLEPLGFRYGMAAFATSPCFLEC